MTEDAMRVFRLYADRHGQAVGMSIVEVPTMRDQFAMAALTGLISRAPDFMFSDLSKKAYCFADDMLEARKEKK